MEEGRKENLNIDIEQQKTDFGGLRDISTVPVVSFIALTVFFCFHIQFNGFGFPELFLVLCFVKHGIRIIFSKICLESLVDKTVDSKSIEGARDKLLFLVEHICFSFWGWDVVVNKPGYDATWLFTASKIWIQPQIASVHFHLYYVAKMATHTEDLVFFVAKTYLNYNIANHHTTASSEDTEIISSDARINQPMAISTSLNTSDGQQKSPKKNAYHKSQRVGTSNFKIAIHHIVSCLLAVGAYALGYQKIGSVLMIIHDLSDIPLDAALFCNKLKIFYNVQVIGTVFTLVSWVYLRMWVLVTVPMYSIFLVPAASYCQICAGKITNMLERCTWLGLISVLLFLHVIWTKEIFLKGWRELF